MPHPASTTTPEERELQRKAAELSRLEEALADNELALATLENQLRSFEAHYFRLIAPLYVELDELEARFAELQAHGHPDWPAYVERAATTRAKASESVRALGNIADVTAVGAFAASDELKGLYREAAKRIHPDLTVNDQNRARRTRVMAEANAAYAQGDVARLIAILEEWHSDPEAVEGLGIGAELVRTIRRIHQVERRLSQIEAAVSSLRQSDLYPMWQEATKAQAAGRDLLTEMAHELKQQIEAAKTRIDLVSATGESQHVR